ncbi:MAG: hypothetical protein PHR20_00815 [Bacteroidales bacterium]|nr:hypothetical protein [Bacteroidales bacterium]
MNRVSQKRYERTLSFIRKQVPDCKTILDLGVQNDFSDILKRSSYSVINTEGEDLDTEYDLKARYKNVDLVTALEIFEHLLNPLSVLQNIPSDKLVASVPLSLWFAKAYKSKTDMRDRHFHEFEDWQFDWLLEKSGWKIVARQKWCAYSGGFGLRPVLRRFVPRHYFVYAEKIR